MGRKSSAKKLLEDLDEEEETDNLYLVSYDFIEEQPHHRFWSTLKEVVRLTGGYRLHYSVYYGNRRGARAVKKLAEMNGADVRWFAALELS